MNKRARSLENFLKTWPEKPTTPMKKLVIGVQGPDPMNKSLINMLKKPTKKPVRGPPIYPAKRDNEATGETFGSITNIILPTIASAVKMLIIPIVKDFLIKILG